MKKVIKNFLALLVLPVFIMALSACSKVDDQSDVKESEVKESEVGSSESKKANIEVLEDGEEFHIGIITGTVSQSEDELRGAEAAIEKYGASSEGGVISHDTYPDRFEAEMETTISKIKNLADDPLMKAIIVNQGIPGTTAAFNKIREQRDDIILVDLTPQEDILMSSAASDLVVEVDNISRGYRMVEAAKKMGATKFAHISFPRHMSIEMLALRRAIMQEACKDLGLEFISLNAPDPTTDIGVPGAQQYVAENIGSWIEKYGKDTAFFTTNDALTEPLLRGVASGGAIFVEPDLPSPIMGYPSAFSVGLSDISGDWAKILERVEGAVVDAGGSERMGTWAYSLGYTNTLATVDLIVDVLHGKADLNNIDDIKKAFESQTEGANWAVSKMVDRASGDTLENFALVSQDTYVFGKGYLGISDVEVPEKYKNLNVDLDEVLKDQEESEGDYE